MTYEAELFIAVVLGLAAGHGTLLYHQGEQAGRDGQRGHGKLVHDRYGPETAHGRQGGLVNPEPCCSFA